MRSPEDAAAGALVHGQEGLRGTLGPVQPGDDGEPQQLIHLEQGGSLLVPTAMLESQADGSFFLPLSPADVDRYRTVAGAAQQAVPPADGSATTIPLAAERLKVGKRRVTTGRVVVHKTVATHEEVVDQPLRSDAYEVERVAVNRIVRQPPPIRQEGDVTIVPLLEEVVLVQKKLMVREEVRITRKRTLTRQPQHVTLRREEARIERIPDPRTPAPRTPDPTQARAD